MENVWSSADIEVKQDIEENKKEWERKLIKSMAGCYKVSFQFSETFAPDKNYQYHDRKFEEAIEYVFILEETENKISLQHILMAGEKMLIKHWRQDWLYENRELLVFVRNNEWKKVRLTQQQVKGTWTQQVFQVNDEPRYQGYGTWVHVDGRHFWESTADAPLPRREITKRHDYDVLKRHSHMELFRDGRWQLEQDNEKIIRDGDQDTLLCWEKGFETFTKSDYDAQRAIDWWEKNKYFWAEVRQCWENIFNQYESIQIKTRVDGKMLYEVLFALGDEHAVTVDYDAQKAEQAIRKVLDSYVEGRVE